MVTAYAVRPGLPLPEEIGTGFEEGVPVRPGNAE